MDFIAARSSEDATKVFVRITGRPAPAAAERPAVHFIAVLDRSGSMNQENRLTNCLDSLRFLTRFLTARDRLSLITFNDTARIAMRAVPMDAAGAERLEASLNITADSGTSISAAIDCIPECVAAASAAAAAAPYKTGILFLTDGHANEGITQAEPLLTMLRSQLTDPAVTVNTIGYGCDHNIGLLQAMAEQNAGSYNVVNDRENVATVFGHLLGGLISCVGSNLRINAPIETTALPSSLQLADALDGVDICVGDIYAETTTDLLLTTRPALSSLLIRAYDAAAAAPLRVEVPVEPATAEQMALMRIFILRQDVAQLLTNISVAPLSAVPTLLTRIQNLQNNCVNTGLENPVVNMLHQQLGDAAQVLRAQRLNTETRTLIAQNSAYTRMGRGLRAQVSGASTVADEDPFSSPAMRQISGITATLSMGVGTADTDADPYPDPFAVHRQVARQLTPDEAAAADATFPLLQAQPAMQTPAAHPQLVAPPPLQRIQYATHLFPAPAEPLLPLPTSPLTRQIAASSRQTSNVSDNSIEPQRLAFNSPLLTAERPQEIPTNQIPPLPLDG